MEVGVSTVLAQNITLVYNSLDLGTIDRNKLRVLVNEDEAPVVMDVPDRLIVVWPPNHLLVDIGDRRFRVTSQKEGAGIGEVPLWTVAAKCNELASSSPLNAYGFNYDVGYEVKDDNAETMMLDRFLDNRDSVEEVLKGAIVSFTPRWKFQRDDGLYDLILEALDNGRIKCHLNIHFQTQSLPTGKQLQDSFVAGYRYLQETLRVLLGGS